MANFDYIPLKFHGKLPKFHVEAQDAVRAVKNETLTSNDFLPTILDNANKTRVDRFYDETPRRESLSSYSVSFYDCIESLEESSKIIPTLGPDKYPYYACGNLLEKFGYATEPGLGGHISFFLFDFEKNNPYNEFVVFKRERFA
jgi:hypothetical protein